MENEIKVYIVLHTINTTDLVGDVVEADPKILGVFRNKIDAQDYADQFLDECAVWENYSILERELV